MKLSERWAQWCKDGLYLPYAHDPTTSQPSVSLLAVYLSLALTVCSLIALHFFPVSTATTFCLVFFTLATIFYLLRKLSKATVNLKEQSFELDSDEGNDEQH